MRKILYLFAITFLMFVSCSSDDNSDTNSSNSFLENYDGTFWEVKDEDDSILDEFYSTFGDYYSFKNEQIFMRVVLIGGEQSGDIRCVSLREGSMGDVEETFIEITKNEGNELWVDFSVTSFQQTMKFSVIENGKKLNATLFDNGKIVANSVYFLSELSFEFFCD